MKGLRMWPSDKDKALLTAEGWEVNCESPFEISTKDGSIATGEAADLVVVALQYETEPWILLNFEEVKACIKAIHSLQATSTRESCSRDFASEEFFEKLLAKFYATHNDAIETKDVTKNP